MKRIALLLLAGCLLAQGPALAQGRDRSSMQREQTQSRERDRRETLTRERPAPREHRREHRFTPAERDKLRQDLLDANRDMRGGRQGRR